MTAGIDDLFAEAERQLVICNACRYCEGYCAVFPALELRRALTSGDITHLADLCHDCRDCYTACMYAPPHEFAVNLPAILSAARRENYDRYLPSLRDVPVPGWLSGRRFAFPGGRQSAFPGGRQSAFPGGRRSTLLTTVVAAVVVFAAIAVGFGGSGHVPGSPYRVVAYPALVLAVLLAAGWGVVIAAWAAARYWRDTGGRFTPAALGRAFLQAATLRNLRGGGADCSYPGDDPSALRRRLHHLVAGGFAACVASTAAAATMQDLAGDPPPYPVLSAPVLLGILGGLGLVTGCAGLLVLKRSSDSSRADPEMTGRDYGLLVSLTVLAVTGLLTLLLRDTPAFGPVLVVHLVAVVASFAIFPYTKFMHVIYRFLALVHHNAEAGSA